MSRSQPPVSNRPLTQKAARCLGSVAIANATWAGGLAHVYLYLVETPPSGCWAFPRVLGFAATNTRDWRALAQNARHWSELTTENKTVACPLATALFALPDAKNVGLEQTLAWLALELYLAGWSERDLSPMCGWLRGLSARRDHKLRDTLGDCNGLEALQARVDSLRARSTVSDVITGHDAYDRAWIGWLGDVVTRLLRPATVAIDEIDPSSAPLDGPDADPIHPWSEDPSEPESLPGWELEAVEDARDWHSPQNRLASAVGKELHRRTSPDLLRDPDNILPLALAREAWVRTVEVTRGLLDSKDLRAAETGLEYLLSIEVGLSRAEACDTAFCEGRALYGPVIDLTIGALRRPERRPRSAYSPADHALSYWQPCGGDILFPLSPTAVGLLQRLLELRAEDEYADTGLLLTATIEPPGAGQHTIARAVPFALDLFDPKRAATRVTHRKRIAACLAGALGQDAAQIAFGETFCASAAPTYYAAYSAVDLACQAAAANVGFLASIPASSSITTGSNASDFKGLLSQALLDACAHTVGSRVRPYPKTFEDAWATVGVSTKRGPGRPKRLRSIRDWRRSRDSLALHLMLATGHRPVAALGMIALTDFLPSRGMVLIRDKRTDPSRLNRLVATGWRFVGALEAYVDDLRRLSRDVDADKAWRDLAFEITHGTAPLFSIPAQDGSIEAFDTGALLSGLPAPWQERPNLHRHALDQALIRGGVDPEFRYFQLGWIEGDVHAVSDMAPYAPMTLGGKLAGPIDAWLTSVGWFGGNEPSDPDSILADIPLRDFEEAHQQGRADAERRLHELKRALSERRSAVTPDVQEIVMEGLAALPVSTVLEPFLSKGTHGTLGLRRKHAGPERPRITRDMVERVLAPLRAPRREPIYGYLGATILSAALLTACRRKLCHAYLPPVQHPSYKAVPSPFVHGVGLATALADELRGALVHAMSRSSQGDGWNRWKAEICVWALLAYTPYRTLEQVRTIVLALDRAMHSGARGWLVRIPFGTGHVVITGAPAILLNRLRAEATWKSGSVANRVELSIMPPEAPATGSGAGA